MKKENRAGISSFNGGAAAGIGAQELLFGFSSRCRAAFGTGIWFPRNVRVVTV